MSREEPIIALPLLTCPVPMYVSAYIFAYARVCVRERWAHPILDTSYLMNVRDYSRLTANLLLSESDYATLLTNSLMQTFLVLQS